MVDISLEAVTGKLNRLGYDAFIQALRQAKGAGNRHVELAHWLGHILQRDAADICLAADYFKLDRARLATDVARICDEFRRNETEMPDISNTVIDVLDRGWHYATLMFGETQIRTGHVLAGALKSRDLRRSLINISAEFAKIAPDVLTSEHRSIWRGSEEENLQPMDGPMPRASAMSGDAQPRGTTALDRFAEDLTAKAASGAMDPILGRDEEIRQVIDVLMRRRQNNPILTGEAGVGKTAVVEGFAQRINAGDVPSPLRGVRLCSLDVGLLRAGASMRGEFEQRLRAVIDEVQGSASRVILFIDEAHMLIGAGDPSGTGDAANLLKPALARGTLRTIAATTWLEYQKYFEKDPALTRRFQPIQIGEPDVARCCDMLRGIAAPMEKHHQVRISHGAIVAAAELSHRYIPARQLPDKAVSLLDTAAARVAIGQGATPAAIEDARARVGAREAEKAALMRDSELAATDEARIGAIDAELASLRETLARLEREWSLEQGLVGEIKALRERLADPGDDAAATRQRLQETFAALEAIDPDRRMTYAHVDEQAVASVVSDWTGIPVGRMMRDEFETVLNLTDILNRRVVGQTHGLRMIARRVETSRAGLDDPSKPIGVFMLCGPSGVGKTETALALADALYGGEQNLITINMSEFQEPHTVSTLKGAPPGYVGYGEGGRLTEAVRRRPYSVVLLDEIEKAHSDVHEIFFQVFDKGQMEDGNGRRIDFKNTLIILTSNVGSELIAGLSHDPKYRDDPAAMAEMLKPELLKVFPAALLGRVVTIPYVPLSDDMLTGIARLHLDRIGRRIHDSHGTRLAYDDAVVNHIVSLCTDVELGGRMIDNIVTNTMLPALSRELLKRSIAADGPKEARVSITNGEFTIEWS